MKYNHIDGVKVSVLTLNGVDCGLEPLTLNGGRSWVRALLGKTKDYKIVYFCFSAKHATLSNKNKDWLIWNQDNVSE